MKAKTQPVLSVSINDLYPDRFDVDDDDYDLEDEPILNLGAESMAPTPPPEPADGSYFPTSIAPARTLNNRKSRLSPNSSSVSRNCDICFKQAVRPSQTQCCGRFFCQDHLQDWFNKPSSNCPSCGSRCSADSVIFSTSESPVMPYAAVPSSLRNPVKTSQEDSDCTESSNSQTSSEERDADSDSDSAEAMKADHEALSFLQNIISSVIDPELAGGVLGKVLSIVALTLVFYVLSS